VLTQGQGVRISACPVLFCSPITLCFHPLLAIASHMQLWSQ